MAPGQAEKGTGPEWRREGFLSRDPRPWGGLAGILVSGLAFQGGDTKVFPGLWEFWTQNFWLRLGVGRAGPCFVEFSLLGVFACFSSGSLAWLFSPRVLSLCGLLEQMGQGTGRNIVLTLITAREAFLKKRLFIGCWLELKVRVVRHGLTSELIPQKTSEPLSTGLAVIPLSLTHQLPRQESAIGHLELFPLPTGEIGWLCAVALLGSRGLGSIPSLFHVQVWK